MRRVGSAMQIIFRFFPCFPLFKYSTGETVNLFFTVFPAQVYSGISSYFYGIIRFQNHPPVSISVRIPALFLLSIPVPISVLLLVSIPVLIPLPISVLFSASLPVPIRTLFLSNSQYTKASDCRRSCTALYYRLLKKGKEAEVRDEEKYKSGLF